MSGPWTDLLRDVARYLEQQQQAGVTSFWDDAAPPAEREAEQAAGAGLVATPRPAAADPIAPQLAPQPAPQPADTREAARQERERAFQAERDAFVHDALALIARQRAAHAEPVALEPAQAAMFAPRAAPVVPASATPPPPPLAAAEREAALETLAGEVRGCTLCGLHAGRNLAVPGTGNPQAGLVLIGEAPGQEEDRQGLPFVGRSGQLLTDILRAIGFERQDVFICNILKCRPPNNRDPEREEVAACLPYLTRQLALIRPRLILCLGRIAAQRLLATDAPLGSLRRALHFYDGIPVMATFHPAALLRQPGQKRQAWDDVRKLRALYDALADGAPGA